MNLRKAIRLMRDAGFWIERRHKHIVMKNEKGVMIPLPNHKELNENTWRTIKKQAGIE